MTAEEKHWLAATFGLGHPVDLQRVARGAMGEVCRLTTTSGTYAAKRHFWDRSHLPHAEFSEAFAGRCRAVGVPVPAAIRDRSGALLARDENGSWWQLAQWLPGARPSADDVETALWLARQTARIHRIGQRPDWAARLDPFYARCDVDWPALCDRAEHAGASYSLATRLPDFVELAAWANSVPVSDLLISHNDLVLSNVLVDGDRRWLIDWDNAGPQDPAREVGVQIFEALTSPGLVAALLGAYRSGGGIGFSWGADIFASAVQIRLNLLAEQLDRFLDPAQSAHHDFADQRVTELLGGTPSLAELRTRVEAVELPSDP